MKAIKKYSAVLGVILTLTSLTSCNGGKSGDVNNPKNPIQSVEKVIDLAGQTSMDKTVEKANGKPSETNYFYTYDEIVTRIRNYFEGKHPFKGLCPLQAEFYIWPEIQLHLAAEALYGQDAGKETTIDAAKDRKEWQENWLKEQMDSKTTEQKFTWCKKKFKLLPVDKKLEFLNERVGQMLKDLRIYQS